MHEEVVIHSKRRCGLVHFFLCIEADLLQAPCSLLP